MKLSTQANMQIVGKVVINGANGYVASNFILELLNNGYQVAALVRKKEGMAAADRMKNVLLEMSSDDSVDFSRLEVYDYSLFKPDFNLPENVLKQVFEGTIHYFHFAASLKFDFSSKEEIFGTNMQGVTNSVETFLKFSGKGSRFYFISTAYSCGNLKGIFQERFYPDEEIGTFRNYYEQSKRFAENRLRQYIEEDRLNCCILRISQIVGQRSTGITKTDYGIFDFSKRIQRIATLNPGTTLRMKIDEKCTQNLLPIDTMVNYFMDILQTEKVPPIINIISKKPVSNRSILEILERLLPIKLVANMKLSNEEMTKMERIMAIGMSFTGAYINIDPTFETRNLDALVTPQPEITPEDVFRMLSYFLQQRKISRQQNTG